MGWMIIAKALLVVPSKKCHHFLYFVSKGKKGANSCQGPGGKGDARRKPEAGFDSSVGRNLCRRNLPAQAL